MRTMLLEILEFTLLVVGVILLIHEDEVWPGVGGAVLMGFVIVNHNGPRLMNLYLPYCFWRRLFWVPKPIYYKLLDWLDGNDGWRPLSMRRDR